MDTRERPWRGTSGAGRRRPGGEDRASQSTTRDVIDPGPSAVKKADSGLGGLMGPVIATAGPLRPQAFRIARTVTIGSRSAPADAYFDGQQLPLRRAPPASFWGTEDGEENLGSTSAGGPSRRGRRGAPIAITARRRRLAEIAVAGPRSAP